MSSYYRAFPRGRVLLVEDEMIKELKLMLELNLREDIELVCAETTSDAEEAIRTAVDGDVPFDLVIKDIKLPAYVGGPKEYDFKICELVANFSGTPILHMTAYGDDACVQDHIRNCLPGPLQGKPMVLVKDGTTCWSKELLHHVRSLVYGKATIGLLDGLFVGSSSGGRMFQYASAAFPLGATHQLAALMRLIERHWADFDPSLQRRIRRHFAVTIEQGRVVDIRVV